MKTAYIVDGLRTPIGKYAGSLSGVRPDDLLANLIKDFVNKYTQIDYSEIDDVIIGNANQSGEDNRNIARMSLLLAGIPFSVPGETINRLCASGMSAIINASRAIISGDADLILAGGVESMSRAPFVMPKASQPFSRDAQIYDTTIGWRFINPKMKELYGVDSMGETAENVAEKYNISRQEQDEFAYYSQLKAKKAIENNRFTYEIAPVRIQIGKNNFIDFTIDEFPRFDTTIESLQKLKPAFKSNGSVTAGNSSGINDGAAILLIASEDALKKYQLEPIARIVSSGVTGVEPRFMGIGPVPALNKALKKANLNINSLDFIELNEAFAAQAVACIKEWGLSTDDERINPNGGAIALGHPLGMSGARIVLTAAKELQLSNKKYAAATMCIGVGQGYATIIEKV